MTKTGDAYVYIWNRMHRTWQFISIERNEEAARKLGRALWRDGAAGVKIDVLTTVVEEMRK